MIAFLSGTVAAVLPPQTAYIDVAGVGYAVAMPGGDLGKLAVGDTARVLTYLSVTENGIALFGFLSEEEKVLFEKLIGVSKVGPKKMCIRDSAYAAAKEGIRGMSRVAATEWGPDGINVNVVCPLAWTAALENFQEAYPDAFTANVHMPPMGHYGNVETEIGRVVVQLASPDFKFMSGETLTLEGGMGQRP